MLTPLDAQALIPVSLQDRKQLIQRQAESIDASHITDEDDQIKNTLRQSYQIHQAIKPLLLDYFKYQINQKNMVSNFQEQSIAISEETKKFSEDFIKDTFNFKKTTLKTNLPLKNQNLLELCNAKLLTRNNSIAISLNTKMGYLWERIANISPYVISPEIEFGIKIPAIDIIIYTDKIEYAQIKTKKDSLSGSHRNSTYKDLSFYENPLFVACFDLGKTWHFSHPKIPRIAGEAFWSKIYIDYNLLVNHLRNMVHEIEKAFVDFSMQ